MHTLTVTSAAESDLEPSKLYSILAEASNIPKWAPAFADAIERINDTHYRVTKNGDAFNLEVSLHQSAGTVDYTREMPGGKRGGAYIRVTPRPLGGSTVTMPCRSDLIQLNLRSQIRSSRSSPILFGSPNHDHARVAMQHPSSLHWSPVLDGV